MAKVGQRGYQPDDLEAVLETRFVVLRNKNRRAGSHRVVGRARGGELVTIVVMGGPEPGVWRPVNAWPADAEERAHAKNAGI